MHFFVLDNIGSPDTTNTETAAEDEAQLGNGLWSYFCQYFEHTSNKKQDGSLLLNLHLTL